MNFVAQLIDDRGKVDLLVGRVVVGRDPDDELLRLGALTLAVAGPEPSTIALLDIKDGIARYEFSVEGTVDFQWAYSELAHLPPSVGWVHYGSLASWLPPGSDSVTVVRNATRAAIVMIGVPLVTLLASPASRASATSPRTRTW